MPSNESRESNWKGTRRRESRKARRDSLKDRRPEGAGTSRREMLAGCGATPRTAQRRACGGHRGHQQQCPATTSQAPGSLSKFRTRVPRRHCLTLSVHVFYIYYTNAARLILGCRRRWRRRRQRRGRQRGKVVQATRRYGQRLPRRLRMHLAQVDHRSATSQWWER